MKYFNGFSLQGEENLFAKYVDVNDFTVAGFSYGAIMAFEYIYTLQTRVEKLILLSPAFFQTQKPSFIRAQLKYYKQDAQSYSVQFLKNIAYPTNKNLIHYFKQGTINELDKLLTYQWSSAKIVEVLERGTLIEVYIGAKDKIIQSDQAFEFFSNLTTTYLIKDAGHILTPHL